ncbi:MAG: hypothetical protein KKI09_15670, partial [Spirochaetes bacterium]|nr:hypothetical protein [Spirochaetota bacterium]MBU0956860.1 hypothetical protein [Spirochaetota bacterium]
ETVAAESAVAAAATSVTAPAADPFTRGYPLVQLQEDFRELQKYIESYHPKLYADREALALLLDTNYALLREGMTELEFLRLLAPIVSVLNCGHSAIFPSHAYQDRLALDGSYFPLLLRFFDGKARIIGNGLSTDLPLGAELLTINGVSMEDIVARLFGSLSADGRNLTRKYSLLDGGFRFYYHNFIDDRSDFDITYMSAASSTVRTAVLAGASDAAIRQANRAFFDARQEFYGQPFTADYADGYARLTMRSFYPQGSNSLPVYKSFIDQFFARVKADSIRSVILDVRDNSGGDPYVAAHLFSYLAAAEQAYFADSAPGYYPSLKRIVPLAAGRFDGLLLVLMNGNSFSTTGHLLALLRSQGVGTFIGEESGGSFACSDGSQNYALRRTGLQYRGSTMVWEVAAKGLEPGRGIMPDHTVQISIADWLAGRDTVLEYAVRLAGRP